MYKLYIAGKIAGDPDYKAKFAKEEHRYRKRGFTVLNPAVLPEGMQKADYMRICLAIIDTADAVAFLPGYETSPGALLELQYRRYTGKEVKLPEAGAKAEGLPEEGPCVRHFYSRFSARS